MNVFYNLNKYQSNQNIYENPKDFESQSKSSAENPSMCKIVPLAARSNVRIGATCVSHETIIPNKS